MDNEICFLRNREMQYAILTDKESHKAFFVSFRDAEDLHKHIEQVYAMPENKDMSILSFSVVDKDRWSFARNDYQKNAFRYNLLAK
jgi:hypothetical protein